MSSSQLPPNLLVHILRQVPPAHRLSSCAVVCTGWAAAAAEATNTIIYSNDSGADSQASLQRYLESHGQHVVYFGVDVDELSVPMAALCSAATGLTELACTATQLPGGAASLAALAALPNLRDLSVELDVDGNHDGPPPDPSCVPASVLRQLVQLTSLSLQGALGLDTLQPLSALLHLQSLCLELNYGLQAQHAGDAALQPAPQQQAQQALQQLTHLQLGTPGLEVSSSGGAAGLSFAGLTALRSLVLSVCSFDAALLHSMPLLESLELSYEVTLLGGGVASLLDGIAGLQHLASLDLNSIAQPLTRTAACAALTSSSKLQYLYLSDCQVTPGFWQHLFRPGCRLRMVFIQDNAGARLTSQDLQHLVTCCPALQHLRLLRTMEPHVNLRPLAQIKRLHTLCISGATDADAVNLKQLTQLTDLTIAPPSPVSIPGLLRLTALTALQRLCIYTPGGIKPSHTLANKAASGAPSDVWYQLLLACASDPQCQAALVARRQEVLQCLQQAGLDASLVEAAIEVAQARAALDAAESRLAARQAEFDVSLLY